MCDDCWGDAPGSPYFKRVEEDDMQPDELSNLGLMLALSELEDTIANSVQAKKEILAEVRNRKEQLREKLRRGDFKLEREDKDNG
jgi:hypothetical protein